MAVSPYENVIELRFLHHFKSFTWLLSVRFQQRSKHSAHTAATWQAQAKHFSLWSYEEQLQKDQTFIVPVLSSIAAIDWETPV